MPATIRDIRRITGLSLATISKYLNGGNVLPENRIRIDFSASGDVKYYNGIAFKGFISGIPDSVLSGGEYGRLLRRMGRRDRAVGFAVFLNMLERLSEGGRTDD